MSTYRARIIETTMTTRYPDDEANVTTEVERTVRLVATDPTALDVVAEKIDHGRKTRRFGIERVEIGYRQVVEADHHNDPDDFTLTAAATPWQKQHVYAFGKAVRVDGSRGVADGFYSWSPRWPRDVSMPEALAGAVALFDAWFEIPTEVR